MVISPVQSVKIKICKREFLCHGSGWNSVYRHIWWPRVLFSYRYVTIRGIYRDIWHFLSLSCQNVRFERDSEWFLRYVFRGHSSKTWIWQLFKSMKCITNRRDIKILLVKPQYYGSTMQFSSTMLDCHQLSEVGQLWWKDSVIWGGISTSYIKNTHLTVMWSALWFLSVILDDISYHFTPSISNKLRKCKRETIFFLVESRKKWRPPSSFEWGHVTPARPLIGQFILWEMRRSVSQPLVPRSYDTDFINKQVGTGRNHLVRRNSKGGSESIMPADVKNKMNFVTLFFPTRGRKQSVKVRWTIWTDTFR